MEKFKFAEINFIDGCTIITGSNNENSSLKCEFTIEHGWLFPHTWDYLTDVEIINSNPGEITITGTLNIIKLNTVNIVKESFFRCSRNVSNTYIDETKEYKLMTSNYRIRCIPNNK